MPAFLDALIKETRAKLADPALPPKRRARLEANLASYNLTAMHAEEGGGDEDEGDDEGGDDDEGEESKAKKAAAKAAKDKRTAEAAKHRAKASEHKQKAAEYEEAAKNCEMDGEEDEASASAAPVAASAGATAAAIDKAREYDALAAKVAELEASATKATMLATIDSKLKGGFISPSQAKMLRDKKPSFVAEYLGTCTAKVVRTLADDEPVRIAGGKAASHGLSAAAIESIEIAVKASTATDKQALRELMIAEHQKAAAQNGAGEY